ncbi:MAG: protoporphyrinogen oxidase [Myxococcota bacterium]
MIAIVGGGISGLALAHALHERGKRVLVLESQPRVGGAMRTTCRDGFLTEWGPNAFVDREPATRTLVRALGLENQLRLAAPEAKQRFVYARGALREVPLSPPALLRSKVLPLPAKLRLLGELFSRRGDGGDESLAEFSRRHLGRTATGVLTDAMQTGTFAGDIERLSAASSFPPLVELERAHRSLLWGALRARKTQGSAAPDAASTGAMASFEGGMETLPAAIARQLGDAVRSGAQVEALGYEGGRWRLSVREAGALATLEADKVVLAVPAFAAAHLLFPLDAELAAELEGIEYAAIAEVHLGFRRSELARRPRGFGFIVPASLRRAVVGAIYVSAVFPWRAPEEAELFTCLVGGALRGEVLNDDDEALFASAGGALRELLGVTAPPLFRELVRWPRGIPQYNVGHLARLERIDARLASHPGLTLTGNAYRGLGVNDCIRNAAALADRLTNAPASLS